MSAECGKCGADLVDWPLRCPECPWRELVEELAKVDPLGEDTYYGCHFCSADLNGHKTGRKQEHDTDCLWRRAVELVRA